MLRIARASGVCVLEQIFRYIRSYPVVLKNISRRNAELHNVNTLQNKKSQYNVIKAKAMHTNLFGQGLLYLEKHRKCYVSELAYEPTLY